jgi:hypothetical protein
MTERSERPDHADAIDASELPSLPDGGLSANMPAWLRSAPAFTRPGEPSAQPIDAGTLTAGIELPDWLSELSARVERGEADSIRMWSSETIEIEMDNVPAAADGASAPVEVTAEHSAPSVPVVPSAAAAVADESMKPLDQRASASPLVEAPEWPASVAGVDREALDEPPYERIRLLLILFALGVIAFTIWATTN